MTNKQALRDAAESTIGILENIAGFEPSDIDGDTVELRFETEGGFDTGCNVSIVDQIQKAADVVRALLDELEAAEKRVADLSSAVIAPGIMRCAGCGFVLTKNSINMAAGTITAGDSKTEPCPNGCGPLWPVTWKEQALEMRDSSEQWFEELLSARQRIAEHDRKCDEQYLLGMSTGWNFGLLEDADCFDAAYASRSKLIEADRAAAGKGE